MRTNGQRPPPASARALPPPAQISSHLSPTTLPPEQPSLPCLAQKGRLVPPSPDTHQYTLLLADHREGHPQIGAQACVTPHTKAPEAPASHTHTPLQAPLSLSSQGLHWGAGDRKSPSPPFHPGSRALLGDAELPAHGGPSPAGCSGGEVCSANLQVSLSSSPSLLADRVTLLQPGRARRSFPECSLLQCWGSHTCSARGGRG